MKNYTGIIFRKELLDVMRDRRSILITVVLPLVLYPLMFWFMGSQVVKELQGPTETVIAVQGGEEAAGPLRALLGDPVFADANIILITPGDALSSVREGEADAAVFVTGEKLSVRLVYDPNKSSSSMAVNHVINLFSAYNQKEQSQKLAEMGISLEELAPLSFMAETLAAEEGEADNSAGMYLSMMLPMLMLILLSVGGMATAVDLFAGEKERRTFEPLLCTGARRADILAGKLGVVTFISLLSALASLGGLVLAYSVSPAAMTMGMDDAQGFYIPLTTILFVLAIIAATAVFFSGLHILLSTYARSVKEASTYGSFVMLASYIPIFASMTMLGGDFAVWTAFIPVMNVTGSLKKVLAGINDPFYMAVTFGVTAAFVGIVMMLGRYMFKKENIMLRA